MKLKPFTHENCRESFAAARRIMGIILFLTAAIQFTQEFYESYYFTQLSIILSQVGVGVFLTGILYKFMASLSEATIYQDQLEIVDFYSAFLGSILIPLIFLFDEDGVIFKSIKLKNSDLIKRIIFIMAFASAGLKRISLHFAKKYSKKISEDSSYKKSEKGTFGFEKTIILNYLSAVLDFILCGVFCYLSVNMEWENALSGEAVTMITIMLLVCAMLLIGAEDEKHIRLIIAIVATVAVCGYFTYMQLAESSQHNIETAKIGYDSGEYFEFPENLQGQEQ